MPNRVQSDVTRVEGQSGGISVPADAFRSAARNRGCLSPSAHRTVASAKVVYEVLASPFEDGTEMGRGRRDLSVRVRLSLGREGGRRRGRARAASRLDIRSDAGTPGRAQGRARRTDEARHRRGLGNLHEHARGRSLSSKTLRATSGRWRPLAPPWSTVPWHLLVLMEEAVTRGYAAFSEGEAARRRIPWMDLVRDRDLRAKLPIVDRAVRAGKLSPGTTEGVRDGRRGASALACARRLRREERPFPRDQWALSAEGMGFPVGRAATRSARLRIRWASARSTASSIRRAR